jgi:hypothetical protein
MSSNAENELLELAAKMHGFSSVTQYLMWKATPDSLMRDVCNDFRGGMPQSTSMLPEQPSRPVVRGSGWVSERPLRSPDGVELIDQMVEADSARQRQEALAKTMKLNLEMAEDLRRFTEQQAKRDEELDPTGQLYSDPDKA